MYTGAYVYLHTVYTQKKNVILLKGHCPYPQVFEANQERKHLTSAIEYLKYILTIRSKCTQHKYLENIKGELSRKVSLVKFLKIGKGKLSKMPEEGDAYEGWWPHREADEDSKKPEVHISIIKYLSTTLRVWSLGGWTHASTLLVTSTVAAHTGSSF